MNGEYLEELEDMYADRIHEDNVSYKKKRRRKKHDSEIQRRKET